MMMRYAVLVVGTIFAIGCKGSSQQEQVAPTTESQDRGAASSQSDDGACAATFSVCAPFVNSVEQVELHNDADERQVTVFLNETGMQAFESFTRTWLGKNVCVVVGTEVLIKSPVRAVIGSGSLGAARKGKNAADRLVSMIKAAPPAPCGEAQKM